MKQHLMYQWKHFTYLKGQIETNITTLMCKDAFNIKFSHCTILHGKRFSNFLTLWRNFIWRTKILWHTCTNPAISFITKITHAVVGAVKRYTRSIGGTVMQSSRALIFYSGTDIRWRLFCCSYNHSSFVIRTCYIFYSKAIFIVVYIEAMISREKNSN